MPKSIFWGKKKKKMSSICCLLNFAQRVVKVNNEIIVHFFTVAKQVSIDLCIYFGTSDRFGSDLVTVTDFLFLTYPKFQQLYCHQHYF